MIYVASPNIFMYVIVQQNSTNRRWHFAAMVWLVSSRKLQPARLAPKASGLWPLCVERCGSERLHWYVAKHNSGAANCQLVSSGGHTQAADPTKIQLMVIDLCTHMITCQATHVPFLPNPRKPLWMLALQIIIRKHPKTVSGEFRVPIKS